MVHMWIFRVGYSLTFIFAPSLHAAKLKYLELVSMSKVELERRSLDSNSSIKYYPGPYSDGSNMLGGSDIWKDRDMTIETIDQFLTENWFSIECIRDTTNAAIMMDFSY